MNRDQVTRDKTPTDEEPKHEVAAGNKEASGLLYGGDAPPSFGATSQTSIAPPPKASCGGDIG
jgi:hypothetical protein